MCGRGVLGVCLLAWTLTVTTVTFDAGNKEWIVGWQMAEDGRPVESGTTRMPALLPQAEADLMLQQVFDEIRSRHVPPVAPGTVIQRR